MAMNLHLQMVLHENNKKMPVQLIYSIFANLKGVFFQALLMFLFPWFAMGKKYVLTGLTHWCPANEMDRQLKCCKYAPETKIIIFFLHALVWVLCWSFPDAARRKGCSREVPGQQQQLGRRWNRRKHGRRAQNSKEVTKHFSTRLRENWISIS